MYYSGQCKSSYSFGTRVRQQNAGAGGCVQLLDNGRWRCKCNHINPADYNICKACNIARTGGLTRAPMKNKYLNQDGIEQPAPSGEGAGFGSIKPLAGTTDVLDPSLVLLSRKKRKAAAAAAAAAAPEPAAAPAAAAAAAPAPTVTDPFSAGFDPAAAPPKKKKRAAAMEKAIAADIAAAAAAEAAGGMSDESSDATC